MDRYKLLSFVSTRKSWINLKAIATYNASREFYSMQWNNANTLFSQDSQILVHVYNQGIL